MKAFTLKVIALYKKLCDTNREFVMSKQLLKSGTSIGANIKEAEQGQTISLGQEESFRLEFRGSGEGDVDVVCRIRWEDE